MKKNNLLKVILITFIIFTICSWFIKGGLFYNGNFYKAEESVAIGIGDFFSLPFQAFYLYTEYGLIFLFIGGLYGIVNKTGAYHNLIKKISSWFLKRKILAIILSSFIIMAFESIVGNSILTFCLIPFFVSLLTELGFNKKIIMLSTIGSLILGSFASLTGFGGLINYLLKISKKSLIMIRLVIFAIAFIIMSVSLLLKSHKDTDNDKMDIKYEEGTKRGIGLTIIFIIFILVSIIGLYNFADYLGIKVFFNFSTNVLSKLKILNGVGVLGSWSTKDLAALILIIILIIGLFYRIKPSDLIEAFKNGAKSMLSVSFYATLAGLIFMYYYNSNEGYNFVDTIVNFIYSSSNEYLVLKTAIATPVYSILLNNQLFLANSIASILTALSTNSSTLASSGLVLQLTSGIFNLILPTSFILIAGLAYFNISYGSWLKYIWKILSVLILITGIIILA